MSERKTHRKKRFCGILCVLGQQTMCVQHANNSAGAVYLHANKLGFLAFGFTLREISLNTNKKEQLVNSRTLAKTPVGRCKAALEAITRR